MWTPEQFVLHGKLCDEKSLSDQLMHIRKDVQAVAVILLVSRGDDFIPSMIRVVHSYSEPGRKLQADLIEGCTSKETTGEIPDRIRYLSISDSTDFFPHPAIPPLLELHFTGADRVALIPFRIENRDAIHPWDQVPPSFMLVIVSPRVPEEHVSRVVNLAQPLTCMISANQTVLARLWNYSMREVDRRLDECERKWLQELEEMSAEESTSERNKFEHLIRRSAKLLLEQATHLTDSPIGQVFITQSDSLRLAVYAYEKFSCNPNSKSLVLRAFDRVQAMLINDIGAFERTHPGIKYLKPTEAHARSQAELIIPITQNSAGDEHVVFGVLNLEKEKGGYTMRDLDVCQHLARRFCRWWARIQHTIFAKSLAQLTRRVALSPSTRQGIGVRVDETADRGRIGHVHFIGNEWYDDRVPSEFRQALRQVKEALKTAFELTRSHMARVFLITADGNALVPYCDYPMLQDELQFEPSVPASFKRVSDSDGAEYDVGFDADGRVVQSPVIMRDRKMRSISAWVAEHGLPCIIGNFDDPHAFAGYEGLDAYMRTDEQTRSECCVPLFITGRLIGTLNFQSVHINAYREQLHLIEAIAELIGLTFAHERRAVEQEIMENHAILAARKHDLMHAMTDLENLAKSQSNRLPPEFLEKLELAKNMIFQIDCRTESQPNGNMVRGLGLSVADLVRRQIPRVRGPVVCHPSLDHACRDDVVTEDSIAAFTYALHEVLQNAQSGVEDSMGQIVHYRWKLEDSGEKAGSVAFGNLVITCERRRLGGREYAMIRVRNRCMNTGAMTFQHVLYRQPFQTSPIDRPHLGAFIAGSMLRSVGGEISFSMERVPQGWGWGFIATTQIELKLQARETHG